MIHRVILLVLLSSSLAFSFTVVRKDGKTFSGELLRQTPEEISIKDTDGVVLRFKADQVDWDKTTQEIRKSETQAKKKMSVSSPETRERKGRKKWTGERLSVDFKDVDLRDFFRFIADTEGMNLILDPAVHGTLTIRMTDVPWDQVLDVVCKNYGLGYEIDGSVVSVRN